MPPAPLPDDELLRLEVLRSYGVLDSPPEDQFDRITRLAQRQLDVPICLVSLIDAERQWFKACVGLDGGVTETPRDQAFCAHAILSDELLMVPDAREDARFSDNPLVTGEPGIRFYMGAPLIAPAGQRIGTLCVIDTEPWRYVPAHQQELLQDLAAIVVDELELRKARKAGAERLHDELVTTRRRSEAAERAKAQFLAMMGHELRTPLNGLMTAARIIETAASPEQMKDMAGVVTESGARMERTIKALLTYAALDRDEVALHEETLWLQEKLASIVTSARALAVERDVQVSVIGGDHAVQADRVQLGEAISQLLLNAIRFGPRGSEVQIQTRRIADGSVCIDIMDDGPGLTPDMVDRAMREFEQLDSGATRPCDGLGLGLPLAGKLIDLHGGSLDVTIRKGGRGTRATLTLPAWRVLDDDVAADARRAAE